MIVKLKTNLGASQFPGMPYRQGEVQDIPDAVASLLIRKGWAEEVVQLKAVPPVDGPEAVTLTKETSTPEVPAVKQKPKGGK